MPQAPNYLREMFEDDSIAWKVIEENFHEPKKNGVIRPKVKGYIPNEKESHALDYLWLEWDYDYES